MKKIFQILFLFLVLLFNPGCNNNKINLKIGMSRDDFLEETKFADVFMEDNDSNFYFFRLNKTDYVVEYHYKNNNYVIKKYRKYKYKVGSDADFVNVNNFEDDIFDVVEKIGIPYYLTFGSQVDYCFKSKELNIYYAHITYTIDKFTKDRIDNSFYFYLTMGGDKNALPNKFK